MRLSDVMRMPWRVPVLYPSRIGVTVSFRRWRALLRPLRKVRDGETVEFGFGLTATVAGRDETSARLVFDREGAAFDAALEAAGAMPLPPYIAGRRAADAQDREDYQAIWARRRGAVAAPTASLQLPHAAGGRRPKKQGVSSPTPPQGVGGLLTASFRPFSSRRRPLLPSSPFFLLWNVIPQHGYGPLGPYRLAERVTFIQDVDYG